MNATQIIQHLALEPHVEGGYFRRTYQSDEQASVETTAGPRLAASSIYYLLTEDQPIGALHKNKSDIMHVHNAGAALRYYLLQPDGKLETIVLGPAIESGQVMQFVAKSGVWKATELVASSDFDFGLLTEVVVPEFAYEDMVLADQGLVEEFPQYREILERFIK